MRAEERDTRLRQQEAAVAAREKAVAERERTAGERDATADRRDRAANDRETMADARDRGADEREAMADKRDRIADDREERLNDLERRLDTRAHTVGLPTASRTQRTLESIERGRLLLEASAASLDRTEAALSRSCGRNHREQEEVDRQVAAGRLEAAKAVAGDGPPAHDARVNAASNRVDMLRQRVIENALRLASAEEELARHHDKLASRNPIASAEHRQTAEGVRASARRVRALARNFARDAPR